MPRRQRPGLSLAVVIEGTSCPSYSLLCPKSLALCLYPAPRPPPLLPLSSSSHHPPSFLSSTLLIFPFSFFLFPTSSLSPFSSSARSPSSKLYHSLAPLFLFVLFDLLFLLSCISFFSAFHISFLFVARSFDRLYPRLLSHATPFPQGQTRAKPILPAKCPYLWLPKVRTDPHHHSDPAYCHNRNRNPEQPRTVAQNTLSTIPVSPAPAASPTSYPLPPLPTPLPAFSTFHFPHG